MPKGRDEAPLTTSRLPFAFEFRFFGDDLLVERERLSAQGVAAGSHDLSESYIVSRFTIDAGVKIRDQRLEIKELIERAGIVEGWMRAQDLALPVTGDVFMTEAGARLGAHIEIETSKSFDEDGLLALVETIPGLRVARLSKHRTLFDLESCRGEFTSFTLGDHRRSDTLAIEGPVQGDVEALVGTLGFTERLNESFPCHLQRLLFYSPAPAQDEL